MHTTLWLRWERIYIPISEKKSSLEYIVFEEIAYLIIFFALQTHGTDFKHNLHRKRHQARYMPYLVQVYVANQEAVSWIPVFMMTHRDNRRKASPLSRPLNSI